MRVYLKLIPIFLDVYQWERLLISFNNCLKPPSHPRLSSKGRACGAIQYHTRMRQPITSPKKAHRDSLNPSINHESTSKPVNADHLVKEQMSAQSLLRSGRSVPSLALTIVVVLATIRVGIVVRTIPGVRQSISRHGVLAWKTYWFE